LESERPLPDAPDGLELRIRLAYEAGRAAHAGVRLSLEEFAGGWTRMEASRRARGHREAGPAADAFLAIACDLDAAGAWETLEREYEERLRRFLRSRGASDAEARDLVSELPGYLREPASDRRVRTRLGTYDASGSLFSWLAVIAIRSLAGRQREARRGGPDGGTPTNLPTLRGAPASGLLSEEASRRFHAALKEAWGTLTPRERLAVLLRYREGLPGREIARLMDVGEPRVSRLLEAGLHRLRDAVRSRMPETPPGTTTPDAQVWMALGEVLGSHLASLSDGSREPERGDGD